MATRFQFHRLALEANERQADIRDDVLPVPTLDERVNLYLRAVHGNREFTDQERSNARNALLDSMAAEINAQVKPEVTEPRPLQPYHAPTQYRQNVRRKETIRAVPLARRPSVLALTATLGLVLIVTGGTLGYRWTHPHIGEEVSEPSQQDRVPSPPTSPRSLSTQHMVQIASQRSEADVLAVFRRLQQEQPTLFGQATLSRIDLVGPQSYSARLGPFASEKEAAAACRALDAAGIQCLRQ
jgi:SPOR domain